MNHNKQIYLFLIENLYKRNVLIEKVNNSLFTEEISLNYHDQNYNNNIITNYDKNNVLMSKSITVLNRFTYTYKLYNSYIIIGRKIYSEITNHSSFNSRFVSYDFEEVKWPYFHIGNLSERDVFLDYNVNGKEIILCGMTLENKSKYFRINLLNMPY